MFPRVELREVGWTVQGLQLMKHKKYKYASQKYGRGLNEGGTGVWTAGLPLRSPFVGLQGFWWGSAAEPRCGAWSWSSEGLEGAGIWVLLANNSVLRRSGRKRGLPGSSRDQGRAQHWPVSDPALALWRPCWGAGSWWGWGVFLSGLFPASLVQSFLPGSERVGALRERHSSTPGHGPHPACLAAAPAF